jgi:glycosyltransferase involved in cell wall biosynthesis
MPEYVAGAHRRAYARLMFGAVRRNAAMVLCDSHFTASEFRRLVGSREPAPRTIHLGVAESWFDVRRERRPHERPFLLYVGNVKPHKNVGALLTAFRALADAVPHDLVAVGKRDGLITADPVAASLAQGLGDRVHFTGLVEPSRLEQYFAHADALVLPSLYEGFGLPPLEAMACGCPVITSDAASLPEVCGEAALYCDPRSPRDIAEKIVRLLSDPDLQDELRRRGRVRAASFSWDRCAEQTLAAIDEVLAM